MHGILDYLEPRFRGPVVIAESSDGDTMEAFESFQYQRLAMERQVALIDLNREGRYRLVPLLDADFHMRRARFAARVRYLRYCGEYGLGRHELGQIEVRGEAIASVRRSYRLHPNVQRKLRWINPGPESVAPEVFLTSRSPAPSKRPHGRRIQNSQQIDLCYASL